MLLAALTWTQVSKPGVVADLVSSEDAAWESSLPTTPGSTLTPGVLNLRSGVATIQFASGAQIVLEAPVAYVGALGSKKTHEKRKVRLAEAGISAEKIATIHGPVGVAINARQPAEIALSIMGQIIAVKNQYL